MALLTLAAAGALFDVLEGTLALALDGAPVAILELPEDVAPALGPASILIAQEGDEPVTFTGTLVFTRAYEGRVSVMWVGGAGTLGGNVGLSAVHYATVSQPVQLADVVRDLVAGAGEQLDDPELATLSGLTVERWTRLRGETWSTALARALDGTGRRYRILDSGRVWVGAESWPDAALDGLELDEDKAGQLLRVGYDRATLRPGTALPDGRRVVRVTFGADGIADVELEADTSGARALAALLTPHLRVDPYARVWSAEVVVQHADGTLDLRALEEEADIGVPFEDLVRVPFDSGVQGARYVLPEGAHVRVRFLGASPSRALAFSRPTAVAANRGVARHLDHCDAGTLTITGAAALGVAFTYTPPEGAGGATTGAITAVASGSPVLFSGAITIALQAVIDRASEEVFIQ